MLATYNGVPVNIPEPIINRFYIIVELSPWQQLKIPGPDVVTLQNTAQEYDMEHYDIFDNYGGVAYSQ